MVMLRLWVQDHIYTVHGILQVRILEWVAEIDIRQPINISICRVKSLETFGFLLISSVQLFVTP